MSRETSVSSCLDGKLREDWERLLFEKYPSPTMTDFTEFIEQRLLWADTQSLSTPSTTSATLSSSTSFKPTYTPTSPRKKPPTMPAKCASCGEAHWLGRCSVFAALSTEERNRLVREKRLCLNCLSPAHAVRSCTNRHSCRHCNLRHHSLLHKEQRTNGSSSTTTTTTTPASMAVVNQPTEIPASPQDSSSGNFICTVTAKLQHEGNIVKARLLLDHGSGGTFMSEELASSLKLKRIPQDRVFEGFGQGTIRSKHKVYTKLHSTVSSFSSSTIEFSVIPHALKSTPPADRDVVLDLAAQNGLGLSDPQMGGCVDILLGQEHPWDLCGEVTKTDRHRFISTHFGYGVIGPLSGSTRVLSIITPATQLDEDLGRLWAMDKVPEASPLSADDQAAVDHFHANVQLQDGRVTVALPRKDNPPPIGNSRKQAMSRLFSNEKSLSTKHKLEPFNAALREYIDLGHAHIIPEQELKLNEDCYYMPVHGVFKESSSTTKTRPVFDASAKTTNGHSLNDTLRVGPNLYPPLADVLVKFRKHAVGISADISKMFREILLHKDHQDLHRFLLRQPTGHIVDCRMERVTFGVASSPFLATQTLRYLADQFQDIYPRASAAISTEFYVDDFVSGADSIETSTQIRIELCSLLARAGMVLRKWRSNSLDFLDLAPASLRDEDSTTLRLAESPKALGIHWDTQNDVLHIAVPDIINDKKITKRSIASISAGVFDILGLFAPVTIVARSILQETWKLNLPWDDEVPQDLQDMWDAWVKDLPKVLDHPIPRRITSPTGQSNFSSLQGFADASTKAYGAAVYLRSVQTDGSVHTSLVTAKARVLPVKHMTIPKAELLGAHLLAKLLAHTGTIQDISKDNLHAWTDSQIVLHWLSKEATQHKDRFVANRVQSVQDLLPFTTWRHVPTDQNPADLASRGVAAFDLIASTLWWSGPPWLSRPLDAWPVTTINRPKEAVQILTISVSLNMDSSQVRFLNSLWYKFSSFFALTRVFAWILRFFNRTKFKKKQGTTHLSSQEIHQAAKKIFLLSQQCDFPEVFAAVKEDRVLPKSHSLHKMLPTTQDGLLYLKSRVRNTFTPSLPKLLLPLHPKSKLTRLWIYSLHQTHLHPGVSALQSIISATHYIPGLRNLLKHVSRSCMRCQRAYAKPVSHQLGLLPAVRTKPSPPFEKTGIDFAGPFTIRRGYTRKPTFDKCYAAVFVCMCTKAVHLDVCASLSTEDFRAALHRFVARRGCPTDVYSDNGSNFIGAREEIRELEALLGSTEGKKMTSTFTQEKGIKWHNIPPRAPHFGGLWEAAVRTMKLLLRKNLQPHPLRYDELYTLLTEAESVLNSRPITTLTEEETQQGSYLTAGHFLIGRPMRALPTSTPSTAKTTDLRRWRLVSKLKSELWQSWIQQYLRTQQERSRWIKPHQPLQTGDLVFLKDEVLKTRAWPLARVVETYPGDDGQVRAVKIRCKGKDYHRAAQMCILFVPDDASPGWPGSLSGNSQT